MKKLIILLALALISLPLFASGKKDTITGRVSFFGSAPVDLFAGFITDDGKQYTFDTSKLGLTLDEISALQGYKLECTGKVYKNKKGIPPLKSLKDGVFVVKSYKKVPS